MLLVLGPKRLPEVGRAIGRGIHDMKSAIDDVKPSREELLGTAEADAPAAAADRKV
jgi:Sec-independent protein translocase protein TatA